MAAAQHSPKSAENLMGVAPAGAAAEAVRNVTKPVFDFETVGVWTMIDNRRDLRELINRLEKLEAMLPEPIEPTDAEQDADPSDPVN